MNIRQHLHEQVHAVSAKHSSYKHNLQVQSTASLKETKDLCSYRQKESLELSTAGASIEELEYTSNPFEWILNS